MLIIFQILRYYNFRNECYKEITRCIIDSSRVGLPAHQCTITVLQIWRPELQGEQQQQNKFKLVKFNGLYHEMENADERVAYLHQYSIADQHFGDLNDRENSSNIINFSLSS